MGTACSRARVEPEAAARGGPRTRVPAPVRTAEMDAARARLPPHLRLGVTLDAVRAWQARHPEGAWEQTNKLIPRDAQGQLKFPPNGCFNGYVNQVLLEQHGREHGGAYAELLQRTGSEHVGPATVFVSLALATPLEEIVDALEAFVDEQPHLERASTYFWLCDFCIRQYDVKADLQHLGTCVRAAGHTALHVDRWDGPTVLQRAYCVQELYSTQAGGCLLALALGAGQRAAFERALIEDFSSIMGALSRVDVSRAQCRRREDQERILAELDALVGRERCNALVIELLREALARLAQQALARLPAEAQDTSALINQLAALLGQLGKHAEAEALGRRALAARERVLGAEHPDTLASLSSLASVRRQQGQHRDAADMYRRALAGRERVLGAEHPDTLGPMSNLAWVLEQQGRLGESADVYRRVLAARERVLGIEHPDTLATLHSLAVVLQQHGAEAELGEAEALQRRAIATKERVLRAEHPSTLASLKHLAGVVEQQGKREEAETLYRRALAIWEQWERLGADPRETLHDRLEAMDELAGFLERQGQAAEAEALYRRALAAWERVDEGAEHDTVLALKHLAGLLKQQGRAAEVEALRQRARQLGARDGVI